MLESRRRGNHPGSSVGPISAQLDDFRIWLVERGHTFFVVRIYLNAARWIDRGLSGCGHSHLGTVTLDSLRASAQACGRGGDPQARKVARLLGFFLQERRLISCAVLRRTEPAVIVAYRRFLQDVRGLAAHTVAEHVATSRRLLDHLAHSVPSERLADLQSSSVESFVSLRGGRVSRGSLQHEIAHLRSLLRFLSLRGEAPTGLDRGIDAPRTYRLEALPRSVPWARVRRFLSAIDRSTPRGLRDYAIFVLMATYGLRASDIVDLKLDDLQWRSETLRVRTRKTSTTLTLPLTKLAGAAVLDYLRRGRPTLAAREVFLRCHAPAGRLQPGAIGEAFRVWWTRSGLPGSARGAHTLRHSLAVRLLRRGTSLKVIGDILGHRDAESTCVYLRLGLEDLRQVALPLPKNRVAP